MDWNLYQIGKRIGRRHFCKIAALLGFIIGLTGTGLLWKAELDQDRKRLRAASQEMATTLSEHLNNRLVNIAQSLRRMASRMGDGAPPKEVQWRKDATRYVADFREFKVVEWIDKSLHIRWIEPVAGNEAAIGLDITFEGKRKAAVQGIVDHGKISMSRTIHLVQGGQGFLIYAPIKPKGKFEGMIAGVCLTDQLISSLPPSVLEGYDFEIFDGDQVIFSTQPGQALAGPIIGTSQVMPYSVSWMLRVTPNREKVLGERSIVPMLILVSGALISSLLAFMILLTGKAKLAADAARRGSVLLKNVFDNAPIGESLVSLDGKWLQVNPALCELLGYSEAELLQLDFQTITHPEDLDADLEFVNQMLREEIHSYQLEKRYFHKSGRTVWIQLNVSMARGENGEKLFFISQIQDITLRKNEEQVLAEFTELLEMQRAELVEVNLKLEEVATTDGLTGLTNRRAMNERLTSLFSLHSRYGTRLSVILFDIDHFKSVNDRFGHQVGDDVLVSVAKVAQQQVRDGDLVARYGGEEFVILCPQTTAADAAVLAERVRTSIEGLALSLGRVTASFGVAEQRDEHAAPHEILSQADLALYESKENGRNRVTIASAKPASQVA